MNRNFFFMLFAFLLILITIMIAVFGFEKILNLIWNTPTMNPVFADIRSITGVNETLSQGLDPLISNPGDPWGRTMNYPRIWQYLAEIFNFTQNTSIYFGFVNLALYIFGFLLFSSRLNLSNAMVFVLLMAFLSPASVLAMERGNIDIVIFFLISLSLFYVSSLVFFSGTILLASFLKIFPIVAIVGLLNQSKKSFITALLISFSIFIIYVFFNMQDIILIKKNTPQDQAIGLSYGMNVIWMATKILFGSNMGMFLKIFTYLYIFLSFVFFCMYLQKKQAIFSIIDTTYIDSFRVGSTIYVATFLLNNNFDYRLIFLIFTIPQLILWIKSDMKILKLTALLSIISIIYTMWFMNLVQISPYSPYIVWGVDELLNLALFSAFSFLLIITLPSWLLEFVRIKKHNDKQTI